MSKPKYRVGDTVACEHGPAIITKVHDSGMLSLTVFRPDAHPTWIVLDPQDLR